jgi:hypothetical protein
MTTLVKDNDGKIIGHIHGGGCFDKHCRKAIREGRVFHATPAGFGVTLHENHFGTVDEAIAALRSRDD